MQGPPGVSGLERVIVTRSTSSANPAVTTVTASCPGTKKVVGGGYSHDFASSVQVLRSSPITGSEGWQVDIRTTGDVVSVTAFAVCATAP